MKALLLIAGLAAGAGAIAAAQPAGQPAASIPVQPTGTAGGALPASTPPTTRVNGCTTSGCHSAQLKHEFLHGPTAVQACDVCHEWVDPAKHSFSLKRTGKDLCSFCHIDKTGQEGPVVHAPVAKGECTGCHDPHGSTTPLMLKKGTIAEMCTSCHTKTISASHVHGPAATECTACHQAHTAQHKNLLNTEGRALCLSCHEQLAGSLGSSVHMHAPVAGDCLQCHSAHASENPSVLKQPAKELCLSCHDKVGKEISSATHPHSAVTDARACLNCHTAHASDHANLLPANPAKACLECHKAPIKTETRTVAAVTDIANTSTHKHGPVGVGDCAACHGVHGSEHNQLLVQNYARDFYVPFTDDSYALCFKCHDKKLASSEKAGKETNFRDAERNLHYVHVAKSPQGRSCRACHTVHAAKNDKQIATTVTFGQWKLPIGFTPTAEGGSCAPGCHKPQSYDRRPVDARGTPSPAPVAPAGPAASAPPPVPAPAKK